jgi:hypothetical protein
MHLGVLDNTTYEMNNENHRILKFSPTVIKLCPDLHVKELSNRLR